MPDGLRLTAAGIVAALCVSCGDGAAPDAPDGDGEPFTLWFVRYSVDGFTDEVSISVSADGEDRRLDISLGCNPDGSVSAAVGLTY